MVVEVFVTPAVCTGFSGLLTVIASATAPMLEPLHALLQAILLALETPRSHRGLQALAKHSKPLAAALLGFLSSTARAQHIQDKSFGTATAQGTAGMSAMPLQAALSSFGRHALPTLKTASDSLEMQTDILLQQQQQQEHVAAQVASISTAHRCLESMLAREAVFSLPAAAIAQALHSPAAVFNTGASMSSGKCTQCTAAQSCIGFTTVIVNTTFSALMVHV